MGQCEGSLRSPAELHLFVESWSKITWRNRFQQRRGCRRPWMQREGGQVWLEMQDDPLWDSRVCEASVAVS